MPVTAERIVDLAPASQFGLIDRYLPDPYRRALTRDGDAMAGLTRVTRGALRRALSELEAVQRSRALEFFNDLSDGALLGALHDQSPWPEDTTDSFRDRLTRVSALAMRGAATADRLLMIAAIACDATRLKSGPGAGMFGPREAYDFSISRKGPGGAENKISFVGQNDPGQSRRFVEKHDGSAVFPVDVFDAPLRRFAADVTPIFGPDGMPDHDFRFVLDNPGSETLAGLEGLDPVLWPDPYFEVTAGAAPFGPFALVNTKTAQTVFVNRRIAAGGSLTIDTRQMAWSHAETGQSELAKFTCLGTKDAVYAGFSLTLDDYGFGAGPLGPMMSLRPKSRVSFTGEKAMAPPVAADLTPDKDLTIPSMLGQGRSHWRIVQLDGGSPTNGDIHDARFRFVPGAADIKVSAYWYARRPGEFTLAVPDTAIAVDMTGPLPHRVGWLDQMVERFKLAGTVQIPQELLFAQFSGFEKTTELTLTSGAVARDGLIVTDPLEMRDAVAPVDAIGVLEGQSFAAASAVAMKDAIDVVATDRALDFTASVLRPGAAVNVASGLPTDFVSRLAPRDDVTVLPELSFAWRDVITPTEVTEVTDTDARPDPWLSTLRPEDRVVVQPGLPVDFFATLAPRDDVTVLPEVGVGFATSAPTLVDTIVVIDEDVAPDALRSALRPGDGVDVTPGLPADFVSTLVPDDDVAVLPELSMVFDSAGLPTGDATVVVTGLAPDPLISTAAPGDTFTITPGLPGDFVGHVAPTDSVEVLPEIGFDSTSTTQPGDAVVVTDDNVPLDGFATPTRPVDTVDVTPGLPSDFSTTVRPSDAVVLIPEITLDWLTPTKPMDGLDLRPGPVLLDFGSDPVRPLSDADVDYTIAFDGRSPLRPKDTVGIDPGQRPDDGGGTGGGTPPDDTTPPDDGPVWTGGGDGPGLDDEPHLDPVPFPFPFPFPFPTATGGTINPTVGGIGGLSLNRFSAVAAPPTLTSSVRPTDDIRIRVKRNRRRRFDVNPNLRRR